MTAGPVDYDAELTRHTAVLRRAWGIRPGDRVLDVGCGAGQTTREAARAAGAGSALGVDLSAPAIGRARELARGLRNVTFECGDAQAYPFAPGSFDVAVSRFGTMFFRDPVAAFGNIARALRPDGRLVMVVWQAADRNEWTVAIRRALGAPPADGTEGPNAFSLGDPATLQGVLTAAGFAGIGLTDIDEPVYYGPDPVAALDWVRGFSCTSETLRRLEPSAAERTLTRLRDLFAARLGDQGVWFGSRAWLVTARRSGRPDAAAGDPGLRDAG